MANKKDDITKDKDVKKILNEIDSQINSKKEEMLKEFTEKMDEQIEIGVQKKLDQLEKKILKGKNGKIIRRDILIVILLVAVVYLAYCLYDIGYFNKDLSLDIPSISQNDNSNTEIEEVKDIAYYIENYSYLVGSLQIPDNLATYQNGITKATLTNDMKLKIGYKNLTTEMQAKSDSLITFSADSILESYQNIMGGTESLEYANFDYETLKFLYYNDSFIAGVEASSDTTRTLITNYNIINAYETDDGLVFEVKYEGQETTLKYVFDLEDGTYYFNRVEK